MPPPVLVTTTTTTAAALLRPRKKKKKCSASSAAAAAARRALLLLPMIALLPGVVQSEEDSDSELKTSPASHDDDDDLDLDLVGRSKDDGEESEPTTTPTARLYSPSRPSFLFLLIDDVGYSDFSYGGGNALTPHIDSWIRKSGSVLLRDMHSSGTVCSPTRATVLTGRNHFRDCVDFVYGCSDMTECVPDFEFAPMRTFTVADAVRSVRSSGKDDGREEEESEEQDDDEGPYGNGGTFFAGKWHLGSFYNDSELWGGLTSSPITHGFHHFNATVEVAPTATVNCQCRAEWLPQCNFGHYGAHEHCQPDENKDCCFNYWWDDVMSPHGVSNRTNPTPADDALYLADAFARFLGDRRRRTSSPSKGGVRGRGGRARNDDSAGPPSPFLAQISFHNCHIPFIGSDEYRSSCSRNVTCRPPRNGDPPYTSEELDYYSCLSQLDAAVGIVLEALENEGYYDNTMIWFTSDNGPEMNCPPQGICQKAKERPERPSEGPGSAGPLRGRKRDVYEGGHRVPGVISWPAFVGGGGRDDRNGDDDKHGERGDGGEAVSPSAAAFETWETIYTTDFLPTVMDVLGVDRPPSQSTWAMDGRSVLPVLRPGGKWIDTKDGERSAGIGYYEINTTLVNGWGYRKGKWKYVEGSASCTVQSCRKPQLYDLDADLGERTDLSGVYPDVLEEMRVEFKTWHESVVQSRKVESKCRKKGTKDLALPQSFSAGDPAAAAVAAVADFDDTSESTASGGREEVA